MPLNPTGTQETSFRMPVYYTAMPDMNFSWVLAGKLAGTRVPIVQDEVEYLKAKGVNAIIRLTER